MNEQCWLGVNPVRRTADPNITILWGDEDASEQLARTYRAAITNYVRRLQQNGLFVILDLHWSAPADSLAFSGWPMPDADHSPAFWKSVASAFRDESSVVFELFRGPYTRDPALLSWTCLRDGCELPNSCSDCAAPVAEGCDACPTVGAPEGTYVASGMQSLVEAVRSAGASQPILVPGLSYSNDLSDWLEYKPEDPLDQIGASFHVYEGMGCADQGCWDRVVATVADRVPVVATEFGPYVLDREEPCREDALFDREFMQWADDHEVSYVAWSWYRDDNVDRPACASAMVRDYDGAPRAGHGEAVRAHFLQRARN